jgi:hypothetical protein
LISKKVTAQERTRVTLIIIESSSVPWNISRHIAEFHKYRLVEKKEKFMHLVFVHIGTAKASHLYFNIKRVIKLFPELKVTLIYSETSFIKKWSDLPINFYKYTEKNDTSHILNNLAHDAKFRMNFWRYSIERLYALAEWHSINPDQKLLHLESDILIMPNFPLEKIEKVNQISWCSFNNSHDVASVVYSPSITETNWMLTELELLLMENSTLTDMTGLRKLKEKFPDKVGYLNSGEAIALFGGVIDAAPYGMWLCGRDPRNHKGVTRRFLELPESDIDPSDVSYHYGYKSYLRINRSGGSGFSLFNLHVHSKHKAIFRNHWGPVVFLYAITSKVKFPKYWFSLTVFAQLASDSVHRNGIKGSWRALTNLLHYR